PLIFTAIPPRLKISKAPMNTPPMSRHIVMRESSTKKDCGKRWSRFSDFRQNLIPQLREMKRVVGGSFGTTASLAIVMQCPTTALSDYSNHLLLFRLVVGFLH